MASNAISHDWQIAPNGTWNGAATLGGNAQDIAVSRNADGRLEVFYIEANNVINHNWQVTAGGSWAGPNVLGGNANQIAVGQNADGRLEIFYIGPGNDLYHNWQVAPNWVPGLETDFQGSAANDTFAGFQFSNPWFGTVRGRAGYAFNHVLVYGTGGFAYGGGSVSVGAISESHTHIGWTAGAGVEVGLAPNWSAKAEYLYVRLDDQSYVLTGLNNGFQSNVVRLGVNYRF
jgi:outer membrane immunogenic protein